MKKPSHVLIFLVALAVYGLTSYAGIRSSDGEVVFEVCDGLLHRHSFAVTGESAWKGFGLATGTDGRTYAIFGPLQSLACVPFLAAADAVDKTGWFNRIDPQRSHNIDGGMRAVLTAAPMAESSAIARQMHARRSLVAWTFNALFGAAGVTAFLRLCLRLARHRTSAALLTCTYGLGSLAWPYSGTFFSEPLAALLVLISLDALLARPPSPRARTLATLLGGVALGLATATHITAVLFAPFWIVIAADGKRDRGSVLRGGAFLAGTVAVLGLLAIFNSSRFGSIWETGRGIQPENFGYGSFQVPGHALWGLLLGPGKGLLLFCPAVLLGAVGWRAFRRQQRLLAEVLLLAIVTRIVFIASRTDWHGGFSLGPRYLIIAIPFLLLPAISWLDHVIDDGRSRALFATIAFLWACSVQQLYFVLGEIFSYFHFVKWRAATAGVDIFANDDIYLLPRYSPLCGLLDGFRGPYLFNGWTISNQTLWLTGAGVLACGWSVAAWRLARRIGGR